MLDEVGYLPLDRAEANMVFQLVARRYERGSIILTSNKAFAEWGGVLGDDVLATAILDRLLHHCDVLSINGPSYRLKDRFLTRTGGRRCHDRPPRERHVRPYAQRHMRSYADIKAVIPEPSDQIGHRQRKGSRGGRPVGYDRELYKNRNVIERGFNTFKQWRGLASRYDKLAVNYRGGAVLRAIMIWTSDLCVTP